MIGQGKGGGAKSCRDTEHRRRGGSQDGAEPLAQEKLQTAKGLIVGEQVSTVLDLPNLGT